MTINEAEIKRTDVEAKFDIFMEWIKPDLIDESQSQTIDDAKWGVLGYFDAEISHADNMRRFGQLENI